MKRFIRALCALLAFPPALFAQAWPTKPVTMINPFAPGGGVDAFGRPLSVYLAYAKANPGKLNLPATARRTTSPASSSRP